MNDPIEAAHYPHGGDVTPKKKSQIIRELREEIDTLRRNDDAEKSWYREYHRTVPELRRRLAEAEKRAESAEKQVAEIEVQK